MYNEYLIYVCMYILATFRSFFYSAGMLDSAGGVKLK